MDEHAHQNQLKWNALVRAGAPCGRPPRPLTPDSATKWLDAPQILGDLNGKSVLCLASGGGQQSRAFALLGAKVTVVDFSEEQLKRDREAATEYENIRIVQSDMRDLSMLDDCEFDVVYQPYSINYIPDVNLLFDEITRVLKQGGAYFVMFHNPFVHGSWKDGFIGPGWKREELWEGKGYPLWQPYKEGHPIETLEPTWNFVDSEGVEQSLPSPQEYKHTLSAILNGLVGRGFHLQRIEEHTTESSALPGTWEHYLSVAPPWLSLWMRK